MFWEWEHAGNQHTAELKQTRKGPKRLEITGVPVGLLRGKQAAKIHARECHRLDKDKTECVTVIVREDRETEFDKEASFFAEACGAKWDGSQVVV